MKTEELTIHSDLRAWREENGLTDVNWETFAKLSGQRIRFMLWAGLITGSFCTAIFILFIIPFLTSFIEVY